MPVKSNKWKHKNYSLMSTPAARRSARLDASADRILTRAGPAVEPVEPEPKLKKPKLTRRQRGVRIAERRIKRLLTTMPPAMQALVEIAKLNPKQGDDGTITCPRCDGDLNWLREKVSGKISGKCMHCNLSVPRL